MHAAIYFESLDVLGHSLSLGSSERAEFATRHVIVEHRRMVVYSTMRACWTGLCIIGNNINSYISLKHERFKKMGQMTENQQQLKLYYD